MNRRSHIFPALLAALAIACLGGCGQRAATPAEASDDHHDHHGAEGGGVAYAEGKGLLLADETRAAVGVRVAPVEMRRADFRPEISAQVFREAREISAPGGAYTTGTAYAAALVPTNAAAGLAPRAEFAMEADPPGAAQLVRVDRQTAQPLGLVELVFALPDAGARWKIGDRVPLRAAANAAAPPVLVVPKAAVLHTATGDFVYAVNGRHLLRTPVKLGRGDRDWTEILDGLFEGDEVAVAALDTLYLAELRAVKGGGHSH